MSSPNPLASGGRRRLVQPYFYLREDEKVLLRLQPPPSYALALFVRPAIIVTVLLALVLGAAAFGAPRSFAAGFLFASGVPVWTPLIVWLLAVALVAIVSWRRAVTTEYALTDERVYARAGRIITRLHFTTHDKITDIRFRQGPFERAFGFSSITFATAGGEVHVAGVRDAMALKAAAEQARDELVRKLLRETGSERVEERRADDARTSATAARAPTAAPRPAAQAWSGAIPDYLQQGDVPVWSARPKLVAAVAALRSLLGIVPLLFFSNFMEGPRRVWIPVAAFGFVLMFVAVRFMQLRRTEYLATERRVYARQGLVGTTVNQLTYDKITDITFQQDVLGRLFGYGSVTLQTAGGSQAPITMVGLAEPLAAKETIEAWRDAAVGGR